LDQRAGLANMGFPVKRGAANRTAPDPGHARRRGNPASSYPGKARKAIYRDADGNEVAFGGVMG
jgi:hypothetical protein